MKQYLRAAGFYLYDAEAAAEESPVTRWIGREVKRFLAQGDIHIPFLLRIAAAPAESLSSSLELRQRQTILPQFKLGLGVAMPA